MAAANALTTVAMAKEYLKIPALVTSEDTMVDFFIDAASELLETECERKFKSQAFTEKQHGRRQNTLLLKQWPVTAIGELRIDNSGVFTDAATIVDPLSYQISDDGNGLVLLRGVFPSGYNNVRVVYTAGYATVPMDLVEACLWLVFWQNSIRNAADIGRTTKNKDAETVSYLQSAPQHVKDCILRYKRTECFVGNAAVQNQ
jgi:hypothetical protein